MRLSALVIVVWQRLLSLLSEDLSEVEAELNRVVNDLDTRWPEGCLARLQRSVSSDAAAAVVVGEVKSSAGAAAHDQTQYAGVPFAKDEARTDDADGG